jgi:hypothetical protein
MDGDAAMHRCARIRKSRYRVDSSGAASLQLVQALTVVLVLKIWPSIFPIRFNDQVVRISIRRALPAEAAMHQGCGACLRTAT